MSNFDRPKNQDSKAGYRTFIDSQISLQRSERRSPSRITESGWKTEQSQSGRALCPDMLVSNVRDHRTEDLAEPFTWSATMASITTEPGSFSSQELRSTSSLMNI